GRGAAARAVRRRAQPHPDARPPDARARHRRPGLRSLDRCADLAPAPEAARRPAEPAFDPHDLRRRLSVRDRRRVAEALNCSWVTNLLTETLLLEAPQPSPP